MQVKHCYGFLIRGITPNRPILAARTDRCRRLRGECDMMYRVLNIRIPTVRHVNDFKKSVTVLNTNTVSNIRPVPVADSRALEDHRCHARSVISRHVKPVRQRLFIQCQMRINTPWPFVMESSYNKYNYWRFRAGRWSQAGALEATWLKKR